MEINENRVCAAASLEQRKQSIANREKHTRCHVIKKSRSS